MSHHDELPGIDPAVLDTVTGGVTLPAASAVPPSTQYGGLLPQQLPAMLMNGSKAATGGACPCGCGMANCRR